MNTQPLLALCVCRDVCAWVMPRFGLPRFGRPLPDGPTYMCVATVLVNCRTMNSRPFRPLSSSYLNLHFPGNKTERHHTNCALLNPGHRWVLPARKEIETNFMICVCRACTMSRPNWLCLATVRQTSTPTPKGIPGQWPTVSLGQHAQNAPEGRSYSQCSQSMARDGFTTTTSFQSLT